MDSDGLIRQGALVADSRMAAWLEHDVLNMFERLIYECFEYVLEVEL